MKWSQAEFQPLYGCVVAHDPEPVKIGFWRRLWFALFGGFARRWNAARGGK